MDLLHPEIRQLKKKGDVLIGCLFHLSSYQTKELDELEREILLISQFADRFAEHQLVNFISIADEKTKRSIAFACMLRNVQLFLWAFEDTFDQLKVFFSGIREPINIRGKLFRANFHVELIRFVDSIIEITCETASELEWFEPSDNSPFSESSNLENMDIVEFSKNLKIVFEKHPRFLNDELDFCPAFFSRLSLETNYEQHLVSRIIPASWKPVDDNDKNSNGSSIHEFSYDPNSRIGFCNGRPFDLSDDLDIAIWFEFLLESNGFCSFPKFAPSLVALLGEDASTPNVTRLNDRLGKKIHRKILIAEHAGTKINPDFRRVK